VFNSVDRRDVRMIQRREQARFARKSSKAIGIVDEGGRKHLDGAVAAQSCVGGTKHLAHATFAEPGDDLVVSDASADQSGDIRMPVILRPVPRSEASKARPMEN